LGIAAEAMLQICATRKLAVVGTHDDSFSPHVVDELVLGNLIIAGRGSVAVKFHPPGKTA
jgi:hypothetical protein